MAAAVECDVDRVSKWSQLIAPLMRAADVPGTYAYRISKRLLS